MSTLCQHDEAANYKTLNRFKIRLKLYAKGDSPVTLHNPPCRSRPGETRFMHRMRLPHKW